MPSSSSGCCHGPRTDIGFTGGEPTLYGDALRSTCFVSAATCCRTRDVHMLSNGRRFATRTSPPLRGDRQPEHDGRHPALRSRTRASRLRRSGRRRLRRDRPRHPQSRPRCGQRIEIRVVIHKQTAPHLVEIADFIARNLPFVDQVALMGLEMIGFARANMDDVWIDPVDYRDELDRSGHAGSTGAGSGRWSTTTSSASSTASSGRSRCARSATGRTSTTPSASAAASSSPAAASSIPPSTDSATTSTRSRHEGPAEGRPLLDIS